jgi:hypothetical protein
VELYGGSDETEQNEPVTGVDVVIVENDGAATVVDSGEPGSVVKNDGAVVDDDGEAGEAIVVSAELNVEYTPQAGVYCGMAQSVGMPVKTVL